MLSGMRKASKNWLGRAVMVVVMGLLVISFGFFGIANWLGGASQSALAKVGSSEISFEMFRNAYTNELNALTQYYRRPITSEQARAAGVDARVLGGMMTDITLDEAAKQRSLHVSDDFIAKQVALETDFKGKDGQFDRAGFVQAARQKGFTEASFLSAKADDTTRKQLVDAVAGGVNAPKALIDLMNREKNEVRSVSFLRLNSTNLPKIIAPDDAQIQSYYAEHKSEFRAPDYRKISLISIGLENFATDVQVSDEDLRLAYNDAANSGKFGKVERRTFEQIVFNDAKEAQAVSDKIKAGTSFDKILIERNLKLEDVTLTTQTKAGLADKDVAEAVFKLPKGAVSSPILGVFGSTIARVVTIEPGEVKPFEQVKASLMVDAKQRKINTSADIRAQLDAARDSIEDLRSSSQSLAEIAQKLNLKNMIIESDSTGHDKNSAVIAIDTEALPTMFAASIGADTEVIRTRNGRYIWYDVQGIEPARDRLLDEIKTAVATIWMTDETNKQMIGLSSDTLKKLLDGVPLVDVAKALNIKIEQGKQLTRSSSSVAEEKLGTYALVQIFITPVNSYGQARVEKSTDRIVFKVNEAIVPALKSDDASNQVLVTKINALYDDDLVNQFVKATQVELGAKVNQRVLNSAIGVN